jgi:Response regulators consisting of a CheY-like receiver domain and a winged-helix DNA-binding domain
VAGASTQELQAILLQLDADLRKLTETVERLARYIATQAEPDALEQDAQPGQANQAGARWTLRDHGWTLVSPEGKTLTLTTAEREFMTALLTSPDHRMARKALYARPSGMDMPLAREGHASRGLDVMVSRLRRKAQLAGMRLPLRSVRRWGYMFAAEAVAE